MASKSNVPLRLLLTVLCLVSAAGRGQAEAIELYFIDAHSRFNQDVKNPERIIEMMDLAGVHRVILSTSHQLHFKNALKLANRYPERVIPAVRTLNRAYIQNSPKWYRIMEKQISNERFAALGVLFLYAHPPEWSERLWVRMSDPRIQYVLEHARNKDWPVVLLANFSSRRLSRQEREILLRDLETLLRENRRQPFVLVSMGGLGSDEVTRLINTYRNIYFSTAHCTPMWQDEESETAWISIFDKNELLPEWRNTLTRHPDRFVFAIGAFFPYHWSEDYAFEVNEYWLPALASLPERAAHAIAHGNAEWLWNIEPK